ncbi:MAG: Zn-ribbon domain-containing OB-fold protein [Deltaproteobacteria bacterium]
MDTQKKPVPIINDWARPFWEATRRHRLIIQKCKDCGKHIFYPRICCPYCFSDYVEWVEASGRGSVYSYTIVENNPPSAFLKDLPYVIAIVKLEEGVQMLSNIVECDPAKVTCDMPVAVTYENLDDEFTLPKFKPV